MMLFGKLSLSVSRYPTYVWHGHITYFIVMFVCSCWSMSKHFRDDGLVVFGTVLGCYGRYNVTSVIARHNFLPVAFKDCAEILTLIINSPAIAVEEEKVLVS